MKIIKLWALASFSISTVALCSALILQYCFGELPCPLCVAQRMAFVLIALVSLVELGLSGTGRKIVAAGNLLMAVIGMSVATYHVAKIYFPGKEETCGPGLGTWIDHLWVTDQLPWLFAPQGDCLRDASTLLGLPLPAYSLALFFVLTVVAKKCISSR
jgi:disulfide bond formation protein DsbB